MERCTVGNGKRSSALNGEKFHYKLRGNKHVLMGCICEDLGCAPSRAGYAVAAWTGGLEVLESRGCI